MGQGFPTESIAEVLSGTKSPTSHRARSFFTSALGAVVSVLIFSGVSIAFASITFNNTAIIGNATTTIDVGSSTLQLQTLNNGPITTGNGQLTVGGNLMISPFVGSTGCLSVASSGIVSTSTCSGGGSYPGVTGDGANGIAVAGNVTAKTAMFGSGNNLQMFPLPTESGFGAGSFTPSANNPISTTARWHGHLFVNSDGSCDYWYYGGAGIPVQYVHATDAMCETWSTPVSITGGPANSFYIDVFIVGGTHYLVISDATVSGPAKNYYLYASTNAGDGNAGTWAILNGGNPIFTASSVSTDWDYKLYNPAIWVDGSTWVLFADGQSTGGVGVATATGCPSSCNFNGNVSTGYVLGNTLGTGGSNPFVVLVPDKNAVVVGTTVNGVGGIQFYTMPSSDNPLLTANWTLAPGGFLGEQNDATTHTGPSDGTLAFSPSNGLKPWNGILSYTYAQSTSYQAYMRLTLDQWYAAITDPVSLPIPYFSQPTFQYLGSGNWVPFQNNHDTSMAIGISSGLTTDENESIDFNNHTGAGEWGIFNLAGNYFEVEDLAHSYFQRIDMTQNGNSKFNAGGSGGVIINSQPNAGTGGFQIYSGGASPTDVINVDSKGALVPKVLYSAAGTSLPTCNSAYQGAELTVSDAASPTYMGTYTSGGTITAQVICSYNGTTYAWLTH